MVQTAPNFETRPVRPTLTMYLKSAQEKIGLIGDLLLIGVAFVLTPGSER